MTERTLKKKITVDETVSFPDHFSDDDTPLGRAVDAYLKCRRFDPDYRLNLYSDDIDVVKTAVANLTEVYEFVEAIRTALNEEQS